MAITARKTRKASLEPSPHTLHDLASSPDTPGMMFVDAMNPAGAHARAVSPGYSFLLTDDDVDHAFRYRGSDRPLAGGSLVVIEPGEVTQVRAQQDLHFRSLFILPQAFGQLHWSDDRRPHFRPDAAPATAQLKRLYGRIHRALTDASTTSLERQSLVLMLIAEAGILRDDVRGERAARRESLRVRRVREMIIDRLDENISLRELADEVGINPFHLLRCFKREIGIPPHEFQLRVRLARAVPLLASGAMAGEVAHILGFVDQSHLHRHFVREWGITPGELSLRSNGARPRPSRVSKQTRPCRSSEHDSAWSP